MNTLPKTYAEATGKTITNWYEELSLPVPLRYTYAFERRLHYLAYLAGDWPTCACGNQCAVLPRHFGGIPTDKQLEQLGMNFYRAVKAAWVSCEEDSYHRDSIKYHLARAIKIFDQIEARSFELIVKLADEGKI